MKKPIQSLTGSATTLADDSLFLTSQEKQQLLQKETFISCLKAKPAMMAAITKAMLKQAEQLMNQWFEAGRNIAILVHGRAWLLDQIIKILWKTHIDIAQINKRLSNSVSLFATGGYGRGELHPCSDIDLLVLSEKKLSDKLTDIVGHFITLLWDSGLKIGACVRSLSSCTSLANKDITVLTSLMEARLLYGSSELQKKLALSISPKKMWSSDHYLQAKYAEQKKRHSKYNQTSYNLEPDLKDAPGGLRDIHLILWVTQRHYGSADLSRLVDIGFLLPEESRQLQKARNTLWRIRWALHNLTGRPEDRLLFDHQKALAEQFGYQDTVHSLAIEQFMRVYFQAVTNIRTLKDLLIQHFHDDILSIDTADAAIPINSHFQLRNHYLEIIHPDIFAEFPPAIFELFVLMTHNTAILGACASTIRALRANLHLIDQSFRENEEAAAFFMKLLKAPYGLSSALRKMARYDILGRYLPEFAKITGQMQYDLFHTYTVEAHTLLLIKFLRRFRYTSKKNDFPLAYKVNATLRAPELLYIAALYHDIAKGRGGDHSELGAIDANAFCKRHHINKTDTALVTWLVKNHLKLSITAQRQDLSDPEVLHKFARFVGSVERLNYLYCLTVADINATNPKLWNSWRATLLDTLYTESQRLLMNSGKAPFGKKRQRKTQQQEALEILQPTPIDRQRITQLWQHTSSDYFLRYSPSEIAWHTKHLLQHQSDDSPMVIARTLKGSYNVGTAIFIYAPYKTTHFSTITMTLENLNFNIMDAKVMILNQHCMDTFIILEADNTIIQEESSRIDEVCHTLKQHLLNPQVMKRIHRKRTPRLLSYFRQHPTIHFTQDTTNQRTVVEIFATDRPGLLSVIIDTFTTCDIHIQNAKILTLGERVEDVFFVSTTEGQPISDPKKLETLKNALIQCLIKYTGKDCYPGGC